METATPTDVSQPVMVLWIYFSALRNWYPNPISLLQSGETVFPLFANFSIVTVTIIVMHYNYIAFPGHMPGTEV